MVAVALGAIVDSKGQLLLLWRPGNVHQGNTWSLPGGKLKTSESPEQALHREIHEETGLTVKQAAPLITLDHNYTDRHVRLHVYLIQCDDRLSQPKPHIKQRHRWTPLNRLTDQDMPAANRGILRALRLPPVVLIASAERALNDDSFFSILIDALAEGIRLLYLRGAGITSAQYKRLAVRTRAVCDQYQATLMLDGRHQQSSTMNCGLHLPAAMAADLPCRPIPESRLLSIACHNSKELHAAIKLHADFIYLSPVRPTTSHRDRVPIGWKKFSILIRSLPMPAYALGGMKPADLPVAWRHQAQGIALHNELWEAKNPRSVVRWCLRLSAVAGRP